MSSTTTFGDVSTELAGAATSDQNSPPSGATASPAEFIDPNDPRLTSEVVTQDLTQDAYAITPPLPDGRWRAKLKQVDIKDDRGNMQRSAGFSRAKMSGGKPFLATNVESSVIDLTGKFDGVKLTEYWVKTLVDERKGISQIGTLLCKLGTPPPASTTQAELMALFLKKLAGEPEIVIETAWNADCQSCQETAKKRGDKTPRPFLVGMHRFPQTAKGPDPVVQCPTCKSQVRAQARIVGFHELTAASK